MSCADADGTRICGAGGRIHLKLGCECEYGRAARTSLLKSNKPTFTSLSMVPSFPISSVLVMRSLFAPPLRYGRHELTFVNSYITPSNFLGCASEVSSHIPSPPSSLMRTLAFSVNSVQISLISGIVKTSKRRVLSVVQNSRLPGTEVNRGLPSSHLPGFSAVQASRVSCYLRCERSLPTLPR